jgi:hypothetical protein
VARVERGKWESSTSASTSYLQRKWPREEEEEEKKGTGWRARIACIARSTVEAAGQLEEKVEEKSKRMKLEEEEVVLVLVKDE